MSYPGLILPTTQSYTMGAGNARDSAIMATQNMNAKQANLVNAVGGKRKRRYRGGADAIVVPQFQMQYNVTNGTGTGPNDQIAGLSSTSMQSASWSVNDNKASIKGGTKRKYKRGGNPDWSWGCVSGGKRRTYKRRISRRKKNNKHRHSRRY